MTQYQDRQERKEQQREDRTIEITLTDEQRKNILVNKK